MTLDDPERSKIKVILFDVKYMENGKSYEVGPMGFTLNYLEKLTGQRSRSQSFDLKYLENSDR